MLLARSNDNSFDKTARKGATISHTFTFKIYQKSLRLKQARIFFIVPVNTTVSYNHQGMYSST